MHTEKLIPVCSSQLEGADGLGRRNEINHDKEVERAVSQGASNESENPAVNSMPVELVQDRRSGKLRIYRLGVLDVVAVKNENFSAHTSPTQRSAGKGRSAVHSAVGVISRAALDEGIIQSYTETKKSQRPSKKA